MGGMSGLLIVDGLEDRLPAELQGVTQRQLAIRDLEHKGGTAILDAAHIDPAGPTTRLVNAQLRPEVSIGSGETQLWRIANVGADLFYDIEFDGHTFTVLGEDGSPRWEVTHRGPSRAAAGQALRRPRPGRRARQLRPDHAQVRRGLSAAAAQEPRHASR